MTQQTTLNPGGSVVYSTRPVGLRTQLSAKCSDVGDSKINWHIELCCQSNHDVSLEAGQPTTIDVSEGAGALMTVSNTGFNPVTVWTDY